MPYKDPEKQREAMRRLSQARQKAELALLRQQLREIKSLFGLDYTYEVI